MTRICWACLLLGWALPAGAAEPAAFRFSKSVERDNAATESILSLEVDSDIYAATREGMADLRVFHGSEETPYLVEKVTQPRTQTVRRPCGSRVVSLHEADDGLEVIVAVEPGSLNIDSLTIHTPLTNYERRVSVAGSKDGTTWTPLVPSALIFDYSRYMDISNREIHLPKNDYPQFKITIAGIADEKQSPLLELTRTYNKENETQRVEKTVLERRPFRIDRVELWHEASEKLSDSEKKAAYPVAEFRVEENAKDKSTILSIRTRREPLTQFLLETSSRNFSRTAVVERGVTRGDRTDWVGVGNGRLSVVDLGGYHDESLSLSFPESHAAEYRIVIRNDDNPPLKITGVKAEGNVYRVVFLAAKDAPYRVSYGSDAVEQPRYDAAAVLTPLRLKQADCLGRLGQEAANPNVGESSDIVARSILNNRLLLGGVTALLIVLLGWALFRAAKRINELPKG